jgi:hypothetical protein
MSIEKGPSKGLHMGGRRVSRIQVLMLRYTDISTPSKSVSNNNAPLGLRAAHMLTVGYRF